MHAQDAASGGGGIFLEEVIDQQRDVFAALAQRRNADRDDVQAIVEIFAKQVFGNGFVEIAVGGGNDAHVDGDFAGAADRTHGALLQHAQQLHLHGQRHLADFVEEDRAAVGDFEQAALVLVGSGERALQIAEQFAFEQRLGKRSAVHGDEGVGGARRTYVNGARNEFFTGAALAVNQNRAGGGGDGAYRLLQLLHGPAGADDVVERVAGGGIAAQRKVLLAED